MSGPASIPGNDARFAAALAVVRRHEGFESNDPNDAGGPTRYGISLKYLRTLGDLNGDGYRDGDLDRDGDVDIDDLKLLTPEHQAALFRAQWWDRYRYGLIDDLDIATKVFDFSVNMGPHHAHVVAQRALRAVGHRVAEDGIMGVRTRDALRAASPRTSALFAAICSEAAGHYRWVVAMWPKNQSQLNGWLNRAYDRWSP